MTILATILETALRRLRAFPVGNLSPSILLRKRRNSAPFPEIGRATPCRLCRPIIAFSALLSLLAVPAAAEDIPRLERRGEATQLIVDGAPFLVLGGEDYLVAGQGVTLTLEPADGRGRLGFERVEDGRYEAGEWRSGRRLNGDQTHQVRHVRLPPGEFGVQRFRLYRY